MSEKTTDAEMEQALRELRERAANKPSKLVNIDGRQFRLGAWYRPRGLPAWLHDRLDKSRFPQVRFECEW